LFLAARKYQMEADLQEKIHWSDELYWLVLSRMEAKQWRMTVAGHTPLRFSKCWHASTVGVCLHSTNRVWKFLNRFQCCVGSRRTTLEYGGLQTHTLHSQSSFISTS
jgi:hypothetical protein